MMKRILLVALALVMSGLARVSEGQSVSIGGRRMQRGLTTAPADGQVPAWDLTNQKWVPVTPTSGSTPTGTGFRRVSAGVDSPSGVELSGDAQTAGNGVVTITGNAVDNTKLADMANHTVKARNTAATGDPEDVAIWTVLDWMGTAQGAILYRTATGWTNLPPGTSGQFLQTQGAGANPLWAASGSYTPPTGTGFPHITGGAQDGAARAVDLSSADATGTLAPARMPALTGAVTTSAGTVATTLANNAVATANITDGNVTLPKMVNATATQRMMGRNTAASGPWEEVTFTQFLDWVGSPAQGDILYRNGSSWVRLGAGTSGQFLQTQGAGANPQWATSGSYTPPTGTGFPHITGGAQDAAATPGDGAGQVVLSSSSTLTNIHTQGITIKDAIDESAAILAAPSSGTVTLSMTNHPWYRTTMSADITTLTLNDTASVTNASIRWDVYTDGTHSITWPSGAVLPATTNQPFAAGLVTVTIERTQGTNYIYWNPYVIGTADIGAQAVTLPKMVNATATQRMMGRNTAASGPWEEVTFTQFLDWVGSPAQGDILYRNGSSWVRLGAGTSGQFLQTQGAGANPQWATSGSYTPPTGTGFAHITSGAQDGAARAVDVSSADITGNLGSGNLANNAVTLPKMVNATATQRVLGRNTAGSGNWEEVTGTQLLDWIGSTRGSILYRGASGWAILAPGTSGNVLTSNGSGADPSYQAASGGTSVYVAGTSVTNPNFDTSQFANNTVTNVVIKNAATVTNLVNSGAVTLTDAATISTDASLGTTFKVTLGGNRTLGNPTNAKDQQEMTFILIQDGTGSRTITLDTKFAFGTDITGVVLTTTASKRDFMRAKYDSTADKFYVVGFVRGY